MGLVVALSIDISFQSQMCIQRLLRRDRYIRFLMYVARLIHYFYIPILLFKDRFLSFSQSNVYVYVFRQKKCVDVCYVLMLTLYTKYIRQKYVSMLTVAILGCTIQKLTILIARGRNHLRLMNWKIAHAKYACSLCPINIVKHNCKSNKRNQSKTLHCAEYLYTNSVVYHPKNESMFHFKPAIFR